MVKYVFGPSTLSENWN